MMYIQREFSAGGCEYVPALVKISTTFCKKESKLEQVPQNRTFVYSIQGVGFWSLRFHVWELQIAEGGVGGFSAYRGGYHSY